ncbi:MAG: glycosyltransferase family 2 protein [Flavobacterium sp.]
MQLSVIILNYNVRHFLELCVLSVQKALLNIDSEIIVVDNASSDESCKMIKERFPTIKLIQNIENEGFPKGNNVGVDQASAKYVCILNPDTLVAEDTFSKMLNYFQTHNSPIGIMGCKLIDGTGHFLPESKRGVPTPWVAFTKISGLYKIFPNLSLMNRYYAQHLLPHETGEVDILVGAMMVMERDFYQQLNGFDETCFMYSDDIDLSYRSLLHHRKNYYFSEATVLHFKGESTVKDVTYFNHFRKAMEYFYQKHFKKSQWFSIFLSMGAFVFSFLKLLKSKPKKTQKAEISILISNSIDQSDFLFQISNSFKQLKIVEKLPENLSEIYADSNKVQVIFDLEFISFKDAFKMMENSNSKSLTFRFLHPEKVFMLGSDSSFERGEVVEFELQK